MQEDGIAIPDAEVRRQVERAKSFPSESEFSDSLRPSRTRPLMSNAKSIPNWRHRSYGES
jgi:hypothetical protein